MDVNEAIYGRRAVREYTAEPIDEARLRALIDAAIQAPSAMNRQPWSFCVVRDQEVLQRISEGAKTHLLRTSPAGLAAHHFEEMLRQSDFHVFYHAPAMILISAIEEGPWSRTDCALAAENLMLAAFGAGLGSCWIGFAQGWLSTPEGKAGLGLPSSYTPVAPIILGHPVRPVEPVPRREPEIQWLTYGQP